MAPGKTAPRLLQDVLTYDARYEKRAANLLVSPPPQHESKGRALAAVPTRNCRHTLLKKCEQSQLPVAGETPDHATVYKVASYCTRCRWHIDVVVDHRSDPGKDRPCKKGDTDYLLHHFLYEGEGDSDDANALGAQLQPHTYTFRCSAPHCPVAVRISLKPPRFSEQDIDTLTNQAQLRRRWEVAKQMAGDRADTTMARRVDAVDFLNTYLQDSLNPSPGKRRIPLLNKRFLKTFGRDCDSILKNLGFSNQSEPEEDGSMCEVWYLPKPEDAKSPLESTLRNKIEDARYEINTIILAIPEAERTGCRHVPMYPGPSRADIERALACADYAKVQGREARSANHEEDHPHYASLGAIGDFDDALILFAFSRQCAVDLDNKSYYFECLQQIAVGRKSEMLETQVALLASEGLVSRKDLEHAYRYFNINPMHGPVIGDDHIIGSFRARLSDISPLQIDEARKQLRVLGDARKSDKLRAEAAGAIETYEQALAWFDLEHSHVDDFVMTMYSLKIEDNPASLETAQRALSIIAEKRKSQRLRQFLKTGAMTEPEMDMGDAYAAFGIQDRNAALDLEVLNSQLSMGGGFGDSARMEKAFALIQQDQASNQNNHIADKNRPEPRRNSYPLETWPVGLRNIGNTCYLNSVLQFLFTIKPLRNLILNCEDHMQDLTPEALKGKTVGRQAITADRVVVAQKFVRELRAFFERMITASTDTVQPNIDLASLALCRTDSPEGPPKSPKVTVTESTVVDSIDRSVASGPQPPPPSGDATPITPADSVMNDDDDAKSDTSTKAMDGDQDDRPAPPTRPPPIPPRPEPQPATSTSTKTKISILEESARQQDAAEVMGNIFDLISCAIKGEGVMRENEQLDAIKKLFFSDVTTILNTAKGTGKQLEHRDFFLVTPGQRDRPLYAALDDDFGQQEIEGGTRYDYIEAAAPIQIINLRRIQFDRVKREQVYARAHIGLDTTMYMDRYLAKTSRLGEDQLLELRKAQWEKQGQLRELDAERTELQTTEIDGMNLAETLEETSTFIDGLLTEKSEHQQRNQPGQDSLPTPPPELADALHDKAKHVAKGVEGIDVIMRDLETDIDAIFRDCNDVPYRLHAVFTHRGGVTGGHYWIYIYDFQNDRWRSYNDDRVEDIDEKTVLEPETGVQPKASTGVVYIRADLVDEYTEAVCRRPETIAEASQADVDMRDAFDDGDYDGMPSLEPAALDDVQIIEGVDVGKE
ncbi:cysteine proteinase [Clathrospora elynae]|uniref:ubiquitinyl hydrolase 1 n=1 Tax=Clathrospora elynae TaxID=706981 RepID=A0A6A5T2L8_9PLEO|nr:cysteine proteinase [Clathrospora elynae]